jgi:carotenoid 1,2-hydratase
MKIQSDYSADICQPIHSSGGYQWWYFDGVSVDDRFSFVVIFYEGNPFSTRYNGAQLAGTTPSASDYPAISISVYEHGKPIYYSFTEFEKSDCYFDEQEPLLEIGDHKMEGTKSGNQLKYTLRLNEQLPNGDELEGVITFESGSYDLMLDDSKSSKGHAWNLVQPRAEVTAELSLNIKGERREIEFDGLGYHDHNTGQEPMRKEFDDWYWGRFHFDYATLVYYVMNRRNEQQHRAWLIDNESLNVLKQFKTISLADKGLTLFGLNTAHKLGFKSDGTEIQIQQSQLLDNGPFYQRFLSDAFLKVPSQNTVESAKGITEYIRPGRIYTRIFWPFVNMRIWYKEEGAHWVQRSQQLYRWTW